MVSVHQGNDCTESLICRVLHAQPAMDGRVLKHASELQGHKAKEEISSFTLV